MLHVSDADVCTNAVRRSCLCLNLYLKTSHEVLFPHKRALVAQHPENPALTLELLQLV